MLVVNLTVNVRRFYNSVGDNISNNLTVNCKLHLKRKNLSKV